MEEAVNRLVCILSLMAKIFFSGYFVRREVERMTERMDRLEEMVDKINKNLESLAPK
jgi:hypothetical protein